MTITVGTSEIICPGNSTDEDNGLNDHHGTNMNGKHNEDLVSPQQDIHNMNARRSNKVESLNIYSQPNAAWPSNLQTCRTISNHKFSVAFETKNIQANTEVMHNRSRSIHRKTAVTHKAGNKPKVLETPPHRTFGKATSPTYHEISCNATRRTNDQDSITAHTNDRKQRQETRSAYHSNQSPKTSTLLSHHDLRTPK